MLTQIYEVASAAEAAAVAAAGIDHVGVLVGDGRFPREVAPAMAAEIAAGVTAPALLSALFLAADLDLVVEGARLLRPAILHLGAASELLGPADVAEIRRLLPGQVIMRSIPVVGEESIAVAQSYDGLADWLLLDSHRAGDTQIGAQGVTHDWSVSRRIAASVAIPVVLAGGLGPDNVAEAIEAVRPAGVDSKTRTDLAGGSGKDIAKVRAFVAAAKRAGSGTATGPGG